MGPLRNAASNRWQEDNLQGQEKPKTVSFFLTVPYSHPNRMWEAANCRRRDARGA